MRRVRSLLGGERGQGLILAALAMLVILGFAAIVLDVGLAYVERRQLQNATDAAALAAAQDLLKEESEATAIATAVDYMERHGFSEPDAGIEVNIPPLNGSHAGESGYVEVAASSEAPMVFLGLFRDDPYTVQARAVAEGRAAGDGDPDSPPPPVPIPANPNCGSPTVDGRVMADEGYNKLADLVGGTNDYGDVFYACDDTYLFFAMRLNGPSTGGAVANENVYGPESKKAKPGYHQTYQTGWEKKHNFKSLKGSDRARFQIACDGVVRHDFIQDYLRKKGNDWFSDADGDGEVLVAGPAESASSLEWNLEHPEETHWGDDPGEVPLVESPPFDPLYPTYDAEYDGWVWEMIYEFKVPKAAYDGCSGPVYFGLHNFAGQSGPLEGIHSSPAKVDEGKYLVLQRVLRLVE